jgi:hypothetical protein
MIPLVTPSPRTARRLKQWLTLLVAVLVTLIGGVLYGNYSYRWGPSTRLRSAASLLREMPAAIGPWVLSEELSLPTYALEMLECAGYVHRRYVHRDTGQAISMAVIVGPPGPTAVHTPEICYSSRAYEQAAQRKRIEVTPVSGAPHSFWYVEFTTTNVMADGLRVYYAWSTGEQWQAARYPRFEFAAVPYLYKLQLAAPIAPQLDAASSDMGRDFLKSLAASDWKPFHQ